MSVTKSTQAFQAKPRLIRCPGCCSTGPFEVDVFVFHMGTGHAVSVDSHGNADWDVYPSDWDECGPYWESELRCDSCQEEFVVDKHVS